MGLDTRHGLLRTFLCGDVMTGRGIDQVLPYPVAPQLHESFVRSALGYVDLAESVNGSIPRPVDFSYVWGDALAEMDRQSSHFRVVNLETSITTSDAAEPKGINYRMSPANIACLQAARLDCCVLANNHVLDWGEAGLVETLDNLRHAGIAVAGAATDVAAAAGPAILQRDEHRLLVFSFGLPSSGVPPTWAATQGRPGVSFLPDVSAATAERVSADIRLFRRQGDIAIVSVHWGGNWGYGIPAEQRTFAHALIDADAADIVHGHSSHHAKGLERYRDRLILYGCGDFLNDYEGIGGYEQYRPDLALAYFTASDETSGRLSGLNIVPFRIRRFRLERASAPDVGWLHRTLNRESAEFGANLELVDGALELAIT